MPRLLIAFFVVFSPTLSFCDEPSMFFWNAKTDYFDKIDFAVADRIPSDFNRDEKTVILIHGFAGNIHTEMYRGFARRLKKYESQTNVIAIDWRDHQNISWMPGTDPVTAASAIPTIANWAYLKLFSFSEGLGLSAQRLHIIGFSHGAHVAALIGKRANGSVAHITLLDPSSGKSHVFSWENFLGKGWTAKESAQFVDMYKTSAWAATHYPRGNQSFYVREKGAIKEERSIASICENHNYAFHWYLSTIGKQNDKFGYSRTIPDKSSQDSIWGGTIVSSLPKNPNEKDYDVATDSLEID